ncbi:MAG: hypothetical protein D6736_10885 [Nitrospinota bacterium]|nr:MAG: hypothetical protein D6736_10885 [Nitrospinota bacterium]
MQEQRSVRTNRWERGVENHKFQEILTVLERCPLCAKIVAFFLRHKAAMDTARGIAEWWVQEDLETTQEALHRLVACRVVIMRTYSGINLYSFTTDPEIQEKLEEYFRQKQESC